MHAHSHRRSFSPPLRRHADHQQCAVRIVRHNRADKRIEYYAFSSIGLPLDSSDARQADSGQPANFRYQCSRSARRWKPPSAPAATITTHSVRNGSWVMPAQGIRSRRRK